MNNVKALVLTGYGLNCDHETAYALELAGANASRVHINSLIDGAVDLTQDLEATVGRVSDLLGDETRERLSRILENVDEATEEANAFAGELREMRAQVSTTLTRVDGLIARNEGNVDESLSNMHTTLEALARRINAIIVGDKKLITIKNPDNSSNFPNEVYCPKQIN